MKSIVICVTIFLLLKTDAYVTNNVNANTTTKPPVNYHEEFSKSSDNSTGSDYFVKDQSGYIYLDDVVFGLKNQNWTSEELPCLNATLHLIKSLQNFTLWSVWEWDSISSQPLGILSGNRYQLGNFDQCMSSPWSTYHPEIKTQYCLAEVALETNEHVKKKTLDEIEPYGNALDLIQHNTPFFRPLKYLTWGACVPACCEHRSVERLVGAVLARSHLGAAGLRPRIHVNETCQSPDEPKKFDAAFYAFFLLSGFLVLIALMCTILKKPDSEDRSLKNAIFKVFCIKENSRDLLQMKRDGIEVIYGIRYLTICFIATCHQSSIIDVGPISNGIKMDESLNVVGWFILHDDLLVDTFFVISAFLVAKGLLESRHIPNVPLLILKRYLRLMVGLAVVVFFMAAVFSHTGSGPLWNRFSDEEVGACRDSWWLNLLMISNYVNPERICVVVTWYIPCDFHFFVVTVLCYTLYRRCPGVGVVIACVLTAASIIVPGYINYVNQLHAIQLFTYDFLMNPRINRQFLLMYIKSHTRAAAYIVGLCAGSLFVKYKEKGAARMSRTRSVVQICAALTVMLLVASLGVSYQLRNYSPLEGHLYAALNRPIFALAVAWFILTCVFGRVPLVTGFLQWYAWVPLSRLAYGVYLIHFSVIIRNVAIARNPEYYDSFNVVITSLGVIAVSTLLAFLLWLFFEAPANRLLVMSLKRLYAKKIVEAITTNGTTPETQVRTNAGYIEDNLPDTIQCSSKM